MINFLINLNTKHKICEIYCKTNYITLTFLLCTCTFVIMLIQSGQYYNASIKHLFIFIYLKKKPSRCVDFSYSFICVFLCMAFVLADLFLFFIGSELYQTLVLKCTYDVNLLIKLFIIFQEWELFSIHSPHAAFYPLHPHMYILHLY